jgi:hypothetical protein
MKKSIAIIFLFFNTSFAISETFEPVYSYAKARPKWMEDNTEIQYIGMRCAGVLDAIVWRFSEDNRPEMKKNADDAKAIGDFFTFSTAAFKDVIGMSEEAYLQRYKKFNEHYKKTARDNAINHNDIFHGAFGNEMKFCTSVLPLYQSILEEIAKASQGN